MKKTIIYYQINDVKNEILVVDENKNIIKLPYSEAALETIKQQTKKITKVEENEKKLLVHYYVGKDEIKKTPFVNDKIVKENLLRIIKEQKAELIVVPNNEIVEQKKPVAKKKSKVVAKKKNNDKNLRNIAIVVASIAIIVATVLGVKSCDKDKEPIKIVDEDLDKEYNGVKQDLVEFIKQINEMGLYDETGEKGLTVEQILNFWMVQNYSELGAEKYAFLYKDSMTSTEVLKNADRSMAYITGFTMFPGRDINLSNYILNEKDKEYVEKLQKEMDILKVNMGDPYIKIKQEIKINEILRELYTLDINSLTASGNYLILNYVYELNSIMEVDKLVVDRTIRVSMEDCEDAVQNQYDMAKEQRKDGFTEWFNDLKTFEVESSYDKLINELKTLYVIDTAKQELDMEQENTSRKTEEQQIIKEEVDKKGSTTKVIKETVIPVPTSGQKPITKDEITEKNNAQEIYWTSYQSGNNKGVADAMKDNVLGNNSNYSPKSYPANTEDKAAYEAGYIKAYNETKKTYTDTEEEIIDVAKEEGKEVVIDGNTVIVYEPEMGVDENSNPTYKGEPIEVEEPIDPNRVIVTPDNPEVNLGLEVIEEETEKVLVKK